MSVAWPMGPGPSSPPSPFRHSTWIPPHAGLYSFFLPRTLLPPPSPYLSHPLGPCFRLAPQGSQVKFVTQGLTRIPRHLWDAGHGSFNNTFVCAVTVHSYPSLTLRRRFWVCSELSTSGGRGEWMSGRRTHDPSICSRARRLESCSFCLSLVSLLSLTKRSAFDA